MNNKNIIRQLKYKLNECKKRISLLTSYLNIQDLDIDLYNLSDYNFASQVENKIESYRSKLKEIQVQLDYFESENQ